jgi:excisionase family DNA binding protein
MTIKNWFTTSEAAAELGVTDARIRQMISAGTLQAIRAGGKSWLIPARVIRRELQERERSH